MEKYPLWTSSASESRSTSLKRVLYLGFAAALRYSSSNIRAYLPSERRLPYSAVVFDRVYEEQAQHLDTCGRSRNSLSRCSSTVRRIMRRFSASPSTSPTIHRALEAFRDCSAPGIHHRLAADILDKMIGINGATCNLLQIRARLDRDGFAADGGALWTSSSSFAVNLPFLLLVDSSLTYALLCPPLLQGKRLQFA